MSDEIAVSHLFRVQWVLMCLGAWSYGNYVTDDRAYGMRLRKVLT